MHIMVTMISLWHSDITLAITELRIMAIVSMDYNNYYYSESDYYYSYSVITCVSIQLIANEWVCIHQLHVTLGYVSIRI